MEAVSNMLGSEALAISGAWLLYFYTTFCNMSVVKVTLIFSIATYLDGILNPLMGFITDSFYRTKLERKFGRRRFFILTGITLMLLYLRSGSCCIWLCLRCINTATEYSQCDSGCTSYWCWRTCNNRNCLLMQNEVKP